MGMTRKEVNFGNRTFSVHNQAEVEDGLCEFLTGKLHEQFAVPPILIDGQSAI